ncbi:MAG TPA: hypothetical protein VFB68_06875 [Xanthobacteraceae bacterium]|nr:hypothetical protein [Xanthobacteraceae bacterium]
MKPRWFFLAFVAVIVALVTATYVPTPRQDVAVLDRLAPRLERTQTLPPETRDAIKQLVDRARTPTGDPRHDVRRSVTIERVTDAIKERDGGGPELSGSVGQSQPSK